jgi:hypothetical protein
VVTRGFLDIYPGQQVIGEEMQNAPQEETHGALGNALDTGALRSFTPRARRPLPAEGGDEP